MLFQPKQAVIIWQCPLDVLHREGEPNQCQFCYHSVCSTYLLATYSLFPSKVSGYRQVSKTVIVFKESQLRRIKLTKNPNLLFIHLFLRSAAVSWDFILEKLRMQS